MHFGLCYMGFYFMDSYWLLLVLPALIVAMIAQVKVKSNFSKYSRVASEKGITGAQAAREILDSSGLQSVRVERVAGDLTDHYDPRAKVIRLSDSVYASTSIAAVGVAAHEAGHAVQHAQKYAPLTLRNAIIPVCNIGSSLAPILLILGFVFSFEPLLWAGIAFFSGAVVFQLITLPVEYNASSRALNILEMRGMLYDDEIDGTRKVLSAAAMTYVGALLVSLMQLLRLILIVGGRSRRN